MSRDVQTTDKLFDVQQAAELLGVNPGTIRRWAQSGTLKGLKVGVRGDWRFTHESLLQLVKSHQPQPEVHIDLEQVDPNQDYNSLPTGKYHEVQFYNDEDYLISKLQNYISAGLDAGEACVIVVTKPHAEMLESRLRMEGVDTAAAAEAGRFLILDAHETLSSFMRNGMPDEDLFNEIIGGVVAEAAERTPRVRLYGEMVALLWAVGNLSGLIRLEELWNELADKYKFSLLCGYSMAAFDTNENANAIDQIGDRHSNVIPAEKSAIDENSAAYLRSIMALQHKAQALQHEIAARESLVSKLEAETRKLKSDHHRLQRLNRAKDEFISIASHQLRTPATGVKQYIGMLIEGYFGILSDDQMRCLQKAYDSNERQIKVVNDLLLIAKVDAGNIHLTSEDTCLAEMITDVVEEQRDEISQHGQAIALLVPDTLLAHVDPQYMRMVVENLVSNASKYSPRDTSIEVAARRTRDSVLISVRDHGIGISAEDQAKLYQKFSRIYNDQSVAEGNGLGLYWSKKIVELHHGQLMLDSEPGRGSIFTIQLPVTH